jgi:hypothetical protein
MDSENAARRLLYACSLYATRPAARSPGRHEHEVYLRVALAVAAGEDEAREQVTARLRELCPPAEGWLNHHVTLSRVHKEHLRELLSAVSDDEGGVGVDDDLDAPGLLM